MTTLGEIISRINNELEKFGGVTITKDNMVEYLNEISEFVVNYLKENTTMTPCASANRNIYYSEEEPIPFATICYNYRPNQEGKEVVNVFLDYDNSFASLEIENVPMASYYEYKASQLKNLEREILLLKEDRMEIEERIIQKEFLYKQLKGSLSGYIY